MNAAHCLHDDTSDAACYQALPTATNMLDTEQTRALRAWRTVQAEHRAMALELEAASASVQEAIRCRDEVAARINDAMHRCGKARRAFLATLGDE